MNYLTLSLLLLSLFSSCGVYNNRFDCSPGEGIGCAPVEEVLDLIVEREEGQDLFVADKGTALLLKQQEELRFTKNKSEPKRFYLVKDDQGNLKLVKAPKEDDT